MLKISDLGYYISNPDQQFYHSSPCEDSVIERPFHRYFEVFSASIRIIWYWIANCIWVWYKLKLWIKESIPAFHFSERQKFRRKRNQSRWRSVTWASEGFFSTRTNLSSWARRCRSRSAGPIGEKRFKRKYPAGWWRFIAAPSGILMDCNSARILTPTVSQIFTHGWTEARKKRSLLF